MSLLSKGSSSLSHLKDFLRSDICCVLDNLIFIIVVNSRRAIHGDADQSIFSKSSCTAVVCNNETTSPLGRHQKNGFIISNGKRADAMCRLCCETGRREAMSCDAFQYQHSASKI